MKKEKTNKNMSETQIRWSIKDAAAVDLNFMQKIKANSPAVANHSTFGVAAGGKLCTGPPGRARSPGVGDDLFPNHPPNSLVCSTITETEKHPVLKGRPVKAKGAICLMVDKPLKNTVNTEYQLVRYNKKQFFTNIKFLKIMKKQILILAFFVVAMIAGSMTSFGQDAVHYSAPRPLNCPADALHPIAGQPWTYEATASVAGTFHFWATKDPNFVTATALQNGSAGLLTTPGDLLSASVNYNTPGATANIQINWSTQVLGLTDFGGTPDITGATPSPTFVAVYFDAADGCSDNFKVWEIDPLVGFTVDVLAIDPDAVTTAPDFTVVPATCLDNVESATYAGGAMVYNYGENYLYFEFVASNFSGSWTPTFALTGMLGTQAVTSYEYTTDLPATWGAGSWAPLVSGTTAIPTTAINTSNGVSVFVRVLVDHNNFEGILGQTLTMTVDGQNTAGQWDVVNDGAPDTCIDPGQDGDDTATTTFTPRPAVTDPTMPAPKLLLGNSVN